ncbi:MAG: alpha/beta fold hydrolase [Ruminococcus sp.]|jgi:alpha-beta hydrolase superfamily lysophospholipase
MEKTVIASEKDGLKLELLIGKPEKAPVGAVQFLHGMCEHKERYIPFMEYLNRHGLVTVIHDHRGHGKSVRSGDDLGYMYGQGGEGLVEDAHCVASYIREHFQNLPLILFGHSMGSLAARVYCKRYDEELSGLILCGQPARNPALPLGIKIAEILKVIRGEHFRSHLLEILTFGPFAMKFPKEKEKFAWICSREEVAREYGDSPLCGFTFTVDGYLALFDLMGEAYCKEGWKCRNPHLPVLFVGGEEDPCMGGKKKFAETVRSMGQAGYDRVYHRRYPGMRHEILNESGRQKVYRDISLFIKKTVERGREKNEK